MRSSVRFVSLSTRISFSAISFVWEGLAMTKGRVARMKVHVKDEV